MRRKRRGRGGGVKCSGSCSGSCLDEGLEREGLESCLDEGLESCLGLDEGLEYCLESCLECRFVAARFVVYEDVTLLT